MYKLCKEYKLFLYTNKKGGNDYSSIRSFIRNERDLVIKLINKLFKYQKILISSYSMLFNYITVLDLNDIDIMKIYFFYEKLTSKSNKSFHNDKQPFEMVYNELSNINDINYSIYYDVTPHEYISRLDVMKFYTDNIKNFNIKNNIQEIKLFIYKISHSILSGNIFGEHFLSKQSSRNSTYTVITSSKCFFGVINYHDYIMCVRCTIDKIRSVYSTYFLKSAIFKNINPNIFEMKYYSLFTYKQFNKGDILIKRNSKQKEIYFLYQGEIDIVIECTIKYLFDILITLNNENNSVVNRIKHLIHSNTMFKNYFENYECVFSLSKYKNHEIIGLNDFIMENKQYYLFDCVCSSHIVECFYIDYNNYEMILNDSLIKSNINEFVNLKRKILCERISIIIESYLNNYNNKYNNKISIKNSLNIDNKYKRNINEKVFKKITQKKIKLKRNNNNTEYNVTINKIYEPPSIEKSFDFPTLKNIYKQVPFYKKIKHSKKNSLNDINKIINNEKVNSFSNENKSKYRMLSSPHKKRSRKMNSLFNTFYSSIPSVNKIKVHGYNDLSSSFKRGLRTKKILIIKNTKGNKSVHVNKVNFYDKKTVYNNDIYMKMNHLVQALLLFFS